MTSYAQPWTRHYQHIWMERTGDSRYPAWLRVAFLALGSHRANGHARFKPGDISMIIGGYIDPDNGEMKTTMNKYAVRDAIKQAVERKWLSPESSSLCLVVPAHAVTGGLGNEHEKCPIHESKRAATEKAIAKRQDRHLRIAEAG